MPHNCIDLLLQLDFAILTPHYTIVLTTQMFDLLNFAVELRVPEAFKKKLKSTEQFLQSPEGHHY